MTTRANMHVQGYNISIYSTAIKRFFIYILSFDSKVRFGRNVFKNLQTVYQNIYLTTRIDCFLSLYNTIPVTILIKSIDVGTINCDHFLK